MHPAKSVIYFTTATGAGYGLFIWLAVLVFCGFLPASGLFGFTSAIFGFISLAIAFGLIISGLLASTLHLGRPERAWRALSQWRSSWLSREGVMAILTFIPMSIFAVSWVFLHENSGSIAFIGLLGAAMSLITVFTTSMIYASLKAIPAWYNIWTKLGYLILSLMSGAILTMALCYVCGFTDAGYHMFMPVIILLFAGLIIKALYWAFIHSGKSVSTAESATGLGQFGKVSLAASPHGEDNYLLKEMGFKIARKHARKIRVIAILMGFIIPALLIILAMHHLSGFVKIAAIVLSALSCMTGLLFERWLFFAEAKHVVTLYYGESKV